MPRQPQPLWPRSRLWRVLVALFGWVVVPALAGFLAVAVLPDLSTTVRIATSNGEPGVFTAASKSCTSDRRSTRCVWRGRFDGADGAVRRPVFYEGDPDGWRPGTTAPVIWLDSRPDAVSSPGDVKPLLVLVLLLAVSGAVLLLWVISVVCRVSGRPAPGWVEATHRRLGWPPVASARSS